MSPRPAPREFQGQGARVGAADDRGSQRRVVFGAESAPVMFNPAAPAAERRAESPNTKGSGKRDEAGSKANYEPWWMRRKEPGTDKVQRGSKGSKGRGKGGGKGKRK